MGDALWGPAAYSSQVTRAQCSRVPLCGPFCYLHASLIGCQALPSMEAAATGGQSWVMRRLVAQLQAVLELVPAHWWVQLGLEGGWLQVVVSQS